MDDGQGKFEEIAVTIKNATQEAVKDQNGKDETCLVLHFSEKIKPMILNVTNSKTIEKLVGSPYVENWTGKRIQIGTEKVRAFGAMHDALRVRKFPPKQDAKPPAPIVACADCNDTIKAEGGVSVDQILAGTKKAYGVELCMSCASIRKAKAATDE